jgi:hypothetical protein
MGGFNPAFFLSVAVALILVLIVPAAQLPSNLVFWLRLLAGLSLAIGILGLG